MINDINPAIAEWHREWQRNRDVIEGERKVKDGSKPYLPKEKGLDDEQYKAVILSTKFFPAASRTHELLTGLLFRKAASINVPDAQRNLLETITTQYLTIDDLAEELAGEFLATNFTGLLVDMPAAPAYMSKAEAEAFGARPTIAVYSAESILDVEAGLVKGGRSIVRVVLQDDAETIRELFLNAGVYTVNIWKKVDGGDYSIVDTKTPLISGKPIAGEGLPFTLVTSNRKFVPSKSKMSDVVNLNVQHFIACSNVALSHYFVSHATPYLFGPTKLMNGQLNLAPGSFISGEVKNGGDVRIGMLEYTGAGISHLETWVDGIGEDMSKVGARVLASEKGGVESAETLTVRTNAENASLTATARLLSRKINDALKWVAYWLGLSEGAITYELNTDFATTKLSKDDITVRFALYQGGAISLDSFLDMLKDGEVLPEHFDKDADAAKKNEEVIDRPPSLPAEETAPPVNAGQATT